MRNCWIMTCSPISRASTTNRYRKSSVPQIVLRWLTQRGVVPVVKSANPERMRQNLAIFDFALSDNEMAAIATLDTGRTCFSPRDTGEAVHSFLEQAMTYSV